MDLLSIEARRNPYPIYDALRAVGPVVRNPRSGAFLVLGHAEIWHMMKTPEIFSSAAAPPRGKPLEQLIFFDPPRHAKLRSLALQAFTPKRVAELESGARSIVARLLDRATTREAFDIAVDVAMPFPVEVLAALLGLPEDDRALFRRWADAIVALSNMVFGGEEAARAASTYREAKAEYEPYVAALAEERRAHPKNDLFTALVSAEVDGERLTVQELQGFFELLLAAGTETSASLIGNAVLTFIERPEVFESLRSSPLRIPPTVEELIRHRTPVQTVFRVTTRDVELRGTTIPARSLILVMIGAANRDPAVFERPDIFDATREPNHHIGFGHGIHFCLGAALGRMEAKVALEEMVRRFDRFDRGSSEPWLPRRPFHVLGPASLVVRAHRAG